MILFRIRQAGYHSNADLFLEEAFRAIHEVTAGYPRQVTLLCHRALKELLLKNKYAVNGAMVEELIEEEARTGWQNPSPLLQKSSY